MKIRKFIILLILNYLRILAKLQLKKFSPTIIGITGSAGKTSLMYSIQNVLTAKYKVKVSDKANSESGLPANILGLSFSSYSPLDWFRVCILAPIKLITNWEKYDIYIAEMAIDSPDEPKNMSYLLKILQPDISIFLNVSAVHGVYFDHLINKDIQGEKRASMIVKLIAEEKGKIITSLGKGKIGIVNSDDNEIMLAVNGADASIVRFGRGEDSELQILDYNISWEGTNYTFKYQGEKFDVNFEDKLLPEYFANNIAATMLVSSALKLSIDEAKDRLEAKFTLQPGRMTVIKGIRNSKIIDSSYNSSFDAVVGLYDMVEKLDSKRKIAVLGDMRELGSQSEELHKKLALVSIEIFEEIVLVGEQMREYFAPEAIRLGFKKEKLHIFETAGEAARFMKENLTQEGDLVVVKGSQNNIFLEIVVEELMDDQARADKLLCRRGAYWDKVRMPYL